MQEGESLPRWPQPAYAVFGTPPSAGTPRNAPNTAKGLLPLAHARRFILGFPNFQSLRSLQVG